MNVSRFIFGFLAILVLGTVVFSCGSSAQKKVLPKSPYYDPNGIHWMTMEEAEAAHKKDPKDIYIMVFAQWCPNCEKFDKTTYLDTSVVNMINRDFYAVKLDAHQPEDIIWQDSTFANPRYDTTKPRDKPNAYNHIVYAIGAKSIPSMVFYNEKMEKTGSIMGYKDATKMKRILSLQKRK